MSNLNTDNIRSIPSLVDGLTPGQRKVLFTCFKRNYKREVQVSQLVGSVTANSDYHHGEVSLYSTIVNLAQNVVGSNNINLLEPHGQFGTRLEGGKDSTSPKYIFTKLSPLTRLIFHPQDDPLLMHEYDGNQKIEPIWYIPILPVVLVNGVDGIGTGWMTKIPNYNSREICQNLLKMLDGEEPQSMIPWYKNFRGTIEDCGEHRYAVSGEVAILPEGKLEITELPIGMSTQKYKENVLEPLLQESENAKAAISDYKEYNTDNKIRFVVTCQPDQMQNIEKHGVHKILKLQSIIDTTSMYLFDELGYLRRYDSVIDILSYFYKLRLEMYQKRKTYLEGMLQSESSKLSNKARFLLEKCDGTLTVENKEAKKILQELIKRNYDPDPIAEWKNRNQITKDNFDQSVDDDDSIKGDDSLDTKFDYLLSMPMLQLTNERKRKLLKQRDSKLDELKVLKQKTPSDLWRADITAFLTKLDQMEQQKRTDES